jgi:hypothetical protein
VRASVCGTKDLVASKGIAFLTELPKPLFEKVTGASLCLYVCATKHWLLLRVLRS